MLIDLLLKKKTPNPEMIASATEHINRVETEMVMDKVEKSTACQSYNNIPKHVLMEYGGTKDALAKFSKLSKNIFSAPILYRFKQRSTNSKITEK